MCRGAAQEPVKFTVVLSAGSFSIMEEAVESHSKTKFDVAYSLSVDARYMLLSNPSCEIFCFFPVHGAYPRTYTQRNSVQSIGRLHSNVG